MKIILVGTEIRTEQELHRTLAEKLDFGPYYGSNLAALWDRMTTDVPRPVQLIWQDSAASKVAMGEEAFEKIMRLFRDVETQDRDLGRSDVFAFTCE